MQNEGHCTETIVLSLTLDFLLLVLSVLDSCFMIEYEGVLSRSQQHEGSREERCVVIEKNKQ